MKKTVFITGATGNLGSAVVEKFVSEGYKILATVSQSKLSGLEGKPDIELFQTDLTDEASASATIATAIAQNPVIDVALLLVGGYASGNLNTTDGNALRKLYTLNFETAYFVVRLMFQQMISQPGGGRIVLVGSRPSLEPKDGKKSLGYALSKSLLFNLAAILNEEGSHKNVVTSVIVPSTIDTPVNRKAMPEADFTKWVQPGAIADTLYFIASKGEALREPVLKIYGNA